MKYADLRKRYSYRQLEKLTGISFQYIRNQEQDRGFSNSTVLAFINAFPKIDTTDMIKNYPIKK